MAEMFANATAYERMMGRWSVHLAPMFLDFAGVPAAGRILDVGCGTGSLSFDDYWSPFLGGIGPQGVYVSDLAPASRDAFRDALRKRLLGDGPDGPILLRARAWAVRGIVPA